MTLLTMAMLQTEAIPNAGKRFWSLGIRKIIRLDKIWISFTSSIGEGCCDKLDFKEGPILWTTASNHSL